MDEGRVLELIDSVYEAAVDPAQWAPFLERLADALHGGWTMLISHNTSPRGDPVSLSIRVDPAAEDLYNSRYSPINPFTAGIGPFLRTGVVVSSEELISDSDLVRTAFYNEFCVPNDHHYTIGAVAAADERGASAVVSTRSKRAGPFDDADRRLLQALSPHLRRALQIQQKLAVTEGQREALDRSPAGCVLLGQGGRVLVANRAAQEVFRRGDGISCLGGQLAAAPGVPGRKFRDLVRAVTSALPMPHPGGLVAIPRSNARQPYSILVAPLPRRQVDWGGCNPVAIVFITYPTPPSKMEFVLHALYRLTRAEARLAAALANGQGLGRAAEELKITRNTAKTQLQQIFAKTQTDRQAELVRLLMTFPWNTNPAESSGDVIRSGDDI